MKKVERFAMLERFDVVNAILKEVYRKTQTHAQAKATLMFALKKASPQTSRLLKATINMDRRMCAVVHEWRN